MKDARELNGMTVGELELRHKELLELSSEAIEVKQSADTVPGRKLLKRLRSDLDSIRAKYSGVSGTDQEILREFSFIQGREYQIKQEIAMFEKAKDISGDILKELDMVLAIMENKRKAKEIER